MSDGNESTHRGGEKKHVSQRPVQKVATNMRRQTDLQDVEPERLGVIAEKG